MAPNRRPVSEAPPYESSSEEESSEEDLGSSEEEEETQHPPQLNTTTTTSTPKKPQPTPTSSAAPNKQPQPTPDTSDDSDSEDGSDSDSDTPPTATRLADPNIKPIASKPMADPVKPTKKSRPDPTPSTPPPKSAAAAVKRPAAESNGALDSKRAKKKQKEKEVAPVIDNNNGATPKKALFQRVWSEDDEIAILKGLIEFRAKKGRDPMSDLNALLAFIKKSLRLGDVSQYQFSSRIRRIMNKFKNNFKKGRHVFSKPHEQLTYDLSKKIWGGESGGLDVGNAEKGSNGKGKKNGKGLSGVDEEGGERVEVEGANAGGKPVIGLDCSVEEVVMKDGLEFVSGSKKLEMMEKWRQFRAKEVELYLMRLDLVREQGKLVLEALKK